MKTQQVRCETQGLLRSTTTASWRVHLRAWVSVVIVAVAVMSAPGCVDPCQQLAERICNCELTDAQRRACRDERISNQSQDPLGRGVETSSAEQDFCLAALETCTCDALDRNQTELCGFTHATSDDDGAGE